MRLGFSAASERVPRGTAAAWEETLDAAIAALGLGALLWPVLFEPNADRDGLASALLPLAGLVLFATVVRLVLRLMSARSERRPVMRLTLVSVGIAGFLGGFVLDANLGAADLDWEVFAAVATLMATAVMTRLALSFRAVEDMHAQAFSSERRFRMVFESAGVGMSIGREGMMTETNEAFRRLLGYSGEELAGMHYLDVTHPDDQDLELEVQRELREGQRPSFTVERRYIDSGERTVWARVTVTRARDGSFGIAVIEDITERHELEERLRQSQKMEAVGQLAGGVAHDFNNLLTAIGGYAELARPRAAGDPELTRSIEAIHGAAGRAASLTQQLLAFSRRQRLEPRVVNVNRVVDSSTELLERLIQEDIQVVTALEHGLPNVMADPDQLTHVLVNLAVNARDAMPSGGTLRISSESVELDHPDAERLSGAPRGSYVRLSVEDTGCGMEPAVLERVFEPFFTTKGVGEGTGLGLSAAYGVVSQSGGYITADSEEGHGSRFDVYLPTTSEPLPAAERPADEPAGAAAARVLVVEDEKIVCELISDSLTAAGYDVTATNDPRRALELGGDERFDVLVTDLTMPHMSGPELARALLEQRPGLRILYTSGYGDAVQDGLVGEGSTFLAKPFGLVELRNRVASLLNGRAAA